MRKIIIAVMFLCLSSFNLKAHESEDFLHDYLENINQVDVLNSKVGFYELKKMIDEEKAVLVDVRYKDEQEVKIKGINLVRMPISEVPDRLNEMPKDKIIITVCGGRCQTGELASIARLYFKSKDYDARVYPFGIENLKSEFEAVKK
ncbi:MAG: hypothetical protein BWY78_00810 [Alphaproteobacteria bacterium ADurb.Bin438]|nr:MAG: hypothetical protein BWY78_00810 [Alphaproteobacteria bacterium ADurb.Bin438]